jgi:hypothetical protein
LAGQEIDPERKGEKMSGIGLRILCSHPQETIISFSGISMQWCAFCGALHYPGPGDRWDIPLNYEKMAVELAETKKVLGNLLGRVKFDENTPPGEHWHIMAVLVEMVQENEQLKAEKGAVG